MNEQTDLVLSQAKAWKIFCKHMNDKHPRAFRFGDNLEVKEGIVTKHTCQICGEDLLPLYVGTKPPGWKRLESVSDRPEDTSPTSDSKD